MPLYEVQHCNSLTRPQKNALAASITQIHRSAYGVPSLFISISFKDISKEDFYAGPKQLHNCNRIFAVVRTGGSRIAADFEKLCEALSKAWEDVITKDITNASRPEQILSGVFVLRSMEASMEHGFILPEAGKDKEWFEQNLPEFQKRAKEGDVDFEGLVKELGF